MESLEWHIRLINRLLRSNPDATIKDYFRITDGYQKEEVKNINKLGAYGVETEMVKSDRISF